MKLHCELCNKQLIDIYNLIGINQKELATSTIYNLTFAYFVIVAKQEFTDIWVSRSKT